MHSFIPHAHSRLDSISTYLENAPSKPDLLDKISIFIGHDMGTGHLENGIVKGIEYKSAKQNDLAGKNIGFNTLFSIKFGFPHTEKIKVYHLFNKPILSQTSLYLRAPPASEY